MLIKDLKKYNNLSRVLNSTFGSEGPMNRPVSTQSIKMTLLDDRMIKAHFMMICNFGSNSMLREMMKRYEVEAMSMLEAAIQKVIEEYKVKFPNSTPVKLDILHDTSNADVEPISYSIYGQPNKGYYRFGVLVEVK